MGSGILSSSFNLSRDQACPVRKGERKSYCVTAVVARRGPAYGGPRGLRKAQHTPCKLICQKKISNIKGLGKTIL